MNWLAFTTALVGAFLAGMLYEMWATRKQRTNLRRDELDEIHARMARTLAGLYDNDDKDA